MIYLRRLLLPLLLGAMLFCNDRPLPAQESDVFHQTNWTGGASLAGLALHPANKTGWSLFYSKSSYIDNSFDGVLTGVPQLLALTDSTDTDFISGTPYLIEVSGTGTDAYLTLQTTSEDPFGLRPGDWSSLPEMPSLAWWSPWVRAGNYIYAIWRNNKLGRYDITAETWTFLADMPVPIGTGAALAYPTNGGDFLYVTRGANTKQFYKYSITADTWTRLADASTFIGYGAALASDGTKVYCLAGAGTTRALAYTIASNTWANMANTPVAVSRGASLVYPGSGTDVFAMFSYNGTTLSRYSVAGNQWVGLTSAPIGVGNLQYTGSGNYFYAYQEDNQWGYFARYNYVTAQWENLYSGTANASIPIYPYRGIFYDPGVGGRIHFLSMGNYARPLHFDPVAAKWDEVMGPRANSWLYISSRMISDGANYIYASSGHNSAEFARYSIANNNWVSLTGMPWAAQYYGHALVYHAGKIYAQQGNLNTGFARYNPADNSWITLSSVPYAVHYGGSLASDGTYIYGFRGNYSATFWRYDPLSNVWDDVGVADLPAPEYVYAGGAMVYPYAPGTGNYIFASTGYSNGAYNRKFWRYQTTNNTWTRMADAPFIFYDKSELVWPGSGDYIYAIFGTAYSFARYNIVSNTWEILPSTPLWCGDAYATLAAQGDKVYMGRGTEKDLGVYTISTNSWNLRYRDIQSPAYGSTVRVDDTVYMFYGNDSTGIWKYSISQKKWIGLITAPFMLGWGSKAAYPGTGNYIYVLEGRGESHLWRYDFVNNVWSPRSDSPFPFLVESQFEGGGDQLFAAAGFGLLPTTQGGNKFMKYTISTNQWTVLVDLPYYFDNYHGRGNTFAFDQSNNMLYWKAGRGAGNFYRYNVGANAWTSLAGAPAAGYNGQALLYPGSGDSIYWLSYQNRFASYSIAKNAWTALAPSSRNYAYTSNDGDMFYPGSGDFLYYFDSSYGLLARYSMSANDWDQPVGHPSDWSRNNYGVFGVGPDEDLLYFGGHQGFWKYGISTRTFVTLNSPYANLNWAWDEWGAALTYSGTGDYLYTTRGRNRTDFARYSVTLNLWTALTPPGGNFGSGHDIAATATKVYCLRGDSRTDFWIYDIATNQWTSGAPVPNTVSFGGSLSYPGFGDYLYATRGNGGSEFYRYSIRNNVWTTLAELPVSLMSSDVNTPSLVYPGRGDYLYFIPTANYGYTWGTNTFLRYSLSQNAWQEVTPSPALFYGGANLVYPGKGDFLYATRGGYGHFYDVFKYRLYQQGQYTSAVKNVGRNSAYNTVNWSDNATGVVEVKVRTALDAAMTGVSKWENINPVNKNSDLSGTFPVVRPGDQYLQYQVSLLTEDPDNLPQLRDVSFNFFRYPFDQELISTPYNSGQALNRLTGVSWTRTIPAGSDIRFQLRTAPDNNGQPGAWGVWLGPGGAQTLLNDMETDSEYSYDPQIEVKDGVARLTKQLEDYAYTQRIVVENNSGADLFNAGLFIELDDNNPHFWEHIKSDGADIRFVDSSGNQLGYNITTSGGYFDYAAHRAGAMVKVFSLPAGQKTSIYLKYGKPDAESASNPDEDFIPAMANLVAYYRFDEGGGSTLNDYSGKGNHGVIVNNPMWVNGKFGKALSFNGANQYVNLGGGTSLKMNLPATFSYWINLPSNIDGNWRIPVASTSWGGSPGYCLMINSRNQFIMTVNGSETTSPRTSWGITTGEWHMITHTVEATTSKLYIDGELKQTFTGNWTLSPGNSTTWLGYSPSGSYSYFWGVMDEVAIYNKALSGTEVEQLFRTSFSSAGGDVVRYYFVAVENNESSPALSGWSHRSEITVDNSLGGQLTNHQVKVTLTAAVDSFWERCRTDGADVRFVDSDNNTILSYSQVSFDYDNRTAVYWVKLPAVPANSVETIYLYYGRSDAAAVSSVSATLTKTFAETGRNTSALSLPVSEAMAVSAAAPSPANALTVESSFEHTLNYWPGGWLYRKEINVNNAGQEAAEYLVLTMDIDYEPGMNPDFSDIRFWEKDMRHKLRYRIRSLGGSKATVYLEVPDLPADGVKHLYIYYGNAAASSESDDSLSDYLYLDDFDSYIPTNYNYSSRVYFENGEVRLLGNNNWSDSYINTKQTFQRYNEGTTFEASFRQASTNEASMIGWKIPGTDQSTGQMPYAIYFENNASIYIYENGTSRGRVSTNYSFGTWYDIKITLQPTQGAKYYYRTTGSEPWTLLYTSTFAPNTTLVPHITHHGRGSYNAYTDNWKVYRGDTEGGALGLTFPVTFGAQETPLVIRSQWLPGFAQRRALTFDNMGLADTENKLYVFDIVYADGKMRSDYGDIRFVDTDGAALSHRILSSSPTQARFMVQVPYVPGRGTKTILMYYGNPGTVIEQDASLPAMPVDGLTNWWKMDENAGYNTEDSAGVIDFNDMGSPLWVDGFSGSALDFIGTTNLTRTDSISLPVGSVMSVGAWINPRNLSNITWNTVISWGNRSSRDSFALAVQNNGRLALATWSNDFISAAGLAVAGNTWNHVAAVLNGTSVKLYINGRSVQGMSGFLNNLPAVQSRNLAIGSLDLAGRYFDGIIDEVTIYNRALSDEEVFGLSNAWVIVPVWGDEENGAVPADQTIVTKSGSYGLKLTSLGLTGFVNETSVSTGDYPTGTLAHAALTYDGARLKLFVDGQEKVSSVLTEAVSANANPVQIGGGLVGLIDEVRIWGQQQAAGDLFERRYRALSGTEPGLLGLWRFNDASGTTAVDGTVYGQNATLSGGAAWLARPFDYVDGAPLAVWHCDEGVGTSTADATANNNRISLVNTAWSSTDLTGFPANKALTFNGTTAYGYAADSTTLDVTGQISLEAWLQPLTIEGNHLILGKGSDLHSRLNYGLYQYSDTLVFSFRNSTQKLHTTGAVLTQGLVHHVVATFDEAADTVKIYVNGNLVYTSTQETSTMLTNNDNLQLGREASAAMPFVGNLDGIRIYDRVLLPREVLAHYEKRKQVENSPLLFDVLTPQTVGAIAVYASSNPVIQPVNGTFYYEKSLVQMQDILLAPYGTTVRYQVSPNGYTWHWWNGTAWADVTGGYSQTNTSAEINAHLTEFQDIYPQGNFYFRAYLHSEPSSFRTPSIESVGVTFMGAQTYYLDPSGGEKINPLHTDADGDQWFQYRALFFSEGQQAAILDDISLDYITAFLNLTAPNGGETIVVGQTYPVTWNSQALQVDGGTGQVKLQYSADNANTWALVAEHVANTGSYDWLVPDAPAQQGFLRISSEDLPTVADVSAASFRVLSLAVTAPNGGEVLEAGRQFNITWNVTGAIPNDVVKIEYTTNGGTSWTVISAITPNDGVYEWVVPAVFADSVLVRISSPSNDRIKDLSDTSFSIVPAPAFSLSSPALGDRWSVGASKPISWRTNSLVFSDQVKLEYSSDGFQADVHEIAQVSVGTPQGAGNNDDILGTYNWQVPDILSANMMVRLTEVGIPAGRGTQQEVSFTSPVFSIVDPAFTLTSPVADVVWVVGDTNNITWTVDGTVSNDLKLEYSLNGTDFVLIAEHVTNTGTYAWVVPPAAVGAAVRLRLTDAQRTQVTITSPAFRVLANNTIELIQPVGGERITMGTDYTVRWRSYGHKLDNGGADYNKISIFYSTDNGSTWTLSGFNQANTGSFTWRVPDEPTETARIKVVDQNDALAAGISPAPFAIELPTVTLTSPVGGESWYATGNYSVTWTSVGSLSANLKLEYSTNNGATWTTFRTGQSNTGSYLWGPVADVDSQTVKVRITDMSYPSVTSTSPADFTIKPPSITLVLPNGGEMWAVGTTQEVRWYSDGSDFGAVRDNITLQYSSNGGSSWNNIATGVANNDLYYWMIPDSLSTNCLIKIFDATRPATTDVSDAAFEISLPKVILTSPNGGELWPVGMQYPITWQSVGAVSNDLKLEYSTDNFSTVHTIAGSVPNTGEFLWTVPDDMSDTVRVRLTDNQRAQITDTSDLTFAITLPRIIVTSPNGGEIVSVGDVENIVWQPLGAISNNLKIEYSKDNFASDVVQIAQGVPNTGTYAWTVPDDRSATLRVRIIDMDRQAVWDKSDADFTILPAPQITLLHPEEGEVWRVGSSHDITWEDNGGRVSNNLRLSYSVDNGASWIQIATGVHNTGSHTWTIPDNVFSTALVRIMDESRPSTVATSPAFNLALPGITITAPNGSEVWSVGDRGPVRWESEGTVSENLLLSYSPDNGITWYLVRGGIPNSGSYSWTVPDYITTQCLVKLVDGNRPAVLDVSDDVFVINPLPTMTFLTPGSGDEYVLADTIPITWEWTGLSIANITLDYSSDNFITRRIIETNLANTGSYDWLVPADAITGRTIKFRLTDGVRSQITATSQGNVRIRGGFRVLSPNGGEKLVARSTHPITWQTMGTINNVRLEYTTDGSNWSFIGTAVNTGTYNWTTPDIKSTHVRVRISDVDDNTTMDTSDADLSLVYATAVFKVMDYDTYQHLTDFSVNEPASGWTDTAMASPVTRTEEYPYGSYTTFFSKQEYIDNSVTWNPPKQGVEPYVVTVYLENAASAQVTWESILTYSFSPATDSLTAVGSLQRKGKLVGTNETERSDMGTATFRIYEPDGTTVRNSMASPAPGTTGMYNFTLADTLFEAGKVYPATLTIEYRGREYTSAANIDVGSEIMQYEFFTETTEQLMSAVSNIQSTVQATSDDMKEVVSKDIASIKTELQNETRKILFSTQEELPTRIDLLQETVQRELSSEILNTESAVKAGETLTIRYRAGSGLVPVIDVYNAQNQQVVASARMTEMTGTGIYQYPVLFYSSWGRGDFTIVCSEPTLGTMDAMTITVTMSDLDQVYSQVSALMGTTSGISGINTTVNKLNEQFTSIENVINDMGSGAFKGAGGLAADAAQSAVAPLFGQLTAMAKQIQSLTGEGGVSLGKMLDVSQERQGDMTYLKNKTQELKAAMEVSKKILENMNNKPVTQVWYEYKE